MQIAKEVRMSCSISGLFMAKLSTCSGVDSLYFFFSASLVQGTKLHEDPFTSDAEI